MTHNRALLAIHLGALMFGLSGIFGKLANTTPGAIVGGRAIFAVAALALFAQLFKNRQAQRPSPRRPARLPDSGAAARLTARPRGAARRSATPR